MIIKLDEKTINKIAAGEVVERPSAVVKELLENSLDAGSTIINIEIKEAGRTLIKVSDNGIGMPPEDLKLSIQRHTTSKISSAEDLFSIRTLGFRGEALASIAAVSNLTIISRQQSSISGFQLRVEGGILKEENEIGCAVGTTVEVKDLFFNTPARKKFMKTDNVELNHIIDLVTRYVLINNNISIKLYHNDQIIINSPATEEMLYNISSIYGTEFVKRLIEVNYQSEILEVNGYISKPSLVRNDRSEQSFFINGRYVKNDTISQAIYDAYHSLLFVGKHPVVIISIKIDPSKIDVNVHPTKQIIKIDQPSLVYDDLYKAIRTSLEENNLFDTKKPKPTQSTLSLPSRSEAYKPITTSITAEQLQQTISEIKQDHSGFIRLPGMKILGQANKTYFLAESDSGILLIDQHIVQERVLYEKFMNELMEGNISTQQLLSPQVIELSPKHTTTLRSNLELFEKLGFIIEDFGENSFVVRSVPSIFSRVQAKDIILEVLESGSKPILDKKEEIITKMSCVNSIKAGDECSIPQITKLLHELDNCVLPWTCPHGREIIINVSYHDIEKMFRRK